MVNHCQIGASSPPAATAPSKLASDPQKPMTHDKVTRHPQRYLIERALALRSPSLRDLGERFGLHYSALCRHRKRMTPEQVADAILGTAGGLTREELFELCRRQHDHIPSSLAIRRQRLEHVAALALKSADWATLAAIDVRLHALDEFTNRLYAPILDGLSASYANPKIMRVERVVIHGVACPAKPVTGDGELEPMQPLPEQSDTSKPPSPDVQGNIVPIVRDPPARSAIFGFSSVSKVGE